MPPFTPSRAQCAVVVPIYRERLSAEEEFSLDYSLERMPGRAVYFAAPENLTLSRYEKRYPHGRFERFPSAHFESIEGYNRLLLTPSFYQRFASCEFALILQTDALVLRDELDHWCSQPFDWIGAPWPGGQMLTLSAAPYSPEHPKRIQTHVGNGGLSLRHIDASLRLLSEFPAVISEFLARGWNEDLFFGLLGTQSAAFRLPHECLASRFALELEPERYFLRNQATLPMGAHAWGRYNMPFWVSHLEQPLPASIPVRPAASGKPRSLWKRFLGRAK
jgi:hypothetical protein